MTFETVHLGLQPIATIQIHPKTSSSNSDSWSINLTTSETRVLLGRKKIVHFNPEFSIVTPSFVKMAFLFLSTTKTMTPCLSQYINFCLNTNKTRYYLFILFIQFLHIDLSPFVSSPVPLYCYCCQIFWVPSAFSLKPSDNQFTQ